MDQKCCSALFAFFIAWAKQVTENARETGASIGWSARGGGVDGGSTGADIAGCGGLDKLHLGDNLELNPLLSMCSRGLLILWFGVQIPAGPPESPSSETRLFTPAQHSAPEVEGQPNDLFPMVEGGCPLTPMFNPGQRCCLVLRLLHAIPT